MNRSAPVQPAPLEHKTLAPPRESTRSLLRELLVLSMPVLAEQVLHMLVGINDTYLANHLVRDTSKLAQQARLEAMQQMAAAAAAVGTISYILWLVGLI